MSGSATIDFWLNHIPTTSAQNYISQASGSNDRWWWTHESGSGMQIEVTISGSNIIDTGWVASTEITSSNKWNHVALVKSQSLYTIFVNGINKHSFTNTTNTALRNLEEPVFIGMLGGAGSYPLRGYIDEFRWSNTARYTGSFTPATAPFERKRIVIDADEVEIKDANLSFTDGYGVLSSETQFFKEVNRGTLGASNGAATTVYSIGATEDG